MTTQHSFSMIRTRDGITLVLDGESYSVDTTHPRFDKIKAAIQSQDYSSLPDLINVARAVTKETNGKVTVVDGSILYNGQPFHNVICDRILTMIGEGFAVDNMLKFVENLMLNPSKRAVDQLYLFLEVCKLPITDDGHFLAYKKVRGDFKDIHSGTFDNSPGVHVEIPRNHVDEDPNRTCSQGLHVCSLSYLGHFGGGVDTSKVLIVKINPRDVVAVPVDYNNAKMRVCAYDVVGIYQGNWEQEAFATSVVTKENVNETAPHVEWSPPPVTNLTDELAVQVRQVVSDQTGFTVNDHTTFGDDLNLAEWEMEDLIFAVEEETGRDLGEVYVVDIHTVRQLIEAVREAPEYDDSNDWDPPF